MAASDLSFEVSRQMGTVPIQPSRIKNVLSEPEAVVGLPDQAGDLSGAATDGRQIQQIGLCLTDRGEGHDGGGAAQINGQRAGCH